MFSALSFNHGNLRDKIDLFIACAPIIILRNSPNTMMQSAAAHWKSVQGVMHKFGYYEIYQDPKT